MFLMFLMFTTPTTTLTGDDIGSILLFLIICSLGIYAIINMADMKDVRGQMLYPADYEEVIEFSQDIEGDEERYRFVLENATRLFKAGDNTPEEEENLRRAITTAKSMLDRLEKPAYTEVTI